MATKKKEPAIPCPQYMGFQLLRMQKYNSRVARIVIKPDERYSFEEANALILKFMNKKG